MLFLLIFLFLININFTFPTIGVLISYLFIIKQLLSIITKPLINN
jgi:hypothetical protein